MWNGTPVLTVRTLLYGAALSARYWLTALIHAVFLHNNRVHSRLRMAPDKVWYGEKPNLQNCELLVRECV